MNQEVLFKARRSDTGHWVHGYYVHFKDSGLHVIHEKDDATVTHTVDESTLCQYIDSKNEFNQRFGIENN